jgi:DNA-binding CsgD family transcriptional regulator
VHRAYMEALLRIDTTDRRLRSTILARAARLAWRQQDHARARELLEQSLAVVRACGDDLAVARRLRSLSLVAVFDGDLETAVELGERSVAQCRAHGDRRGLALGQIAVGWARYLRGDVAEGNDRMGDALSISRELEFGPGAVFGLQGLTSGALLAGDTATARRHLVDQLAAIRETGTARSELGWQWSGAVLAADEGRFAAALRLMGAAEAHGRTRGSQLEQRLPWLTRLQPRLDRAAEALGSVESDRLVAAGARMTVGELMDEACAEPGSEETGDDPLSPREREVVELVGQGLTNSQIAEALFISKRTVESHVDHIKQKLGHVSRSQVIAWAVRRAGGGAAPAPAGG